MSKTKSQDKTAAKPGRPRKVMVEHIEYDSENQARERLDQETVAEYAQAMEDGADLPPIVCYHDGSTYWLADGFHRYHAARKRGEKLLDAQVIKGSRDDARWHAAGANTAHGLKRTVSDKQRAVRLALELRPKLSDRAIAEHCGVSAPMVSGIRSRLSTVKVLQSDATPLRTGADGRAINTANIGRRPEPRAQATESPAEPSDPWEDSEGEDEPAAAPVKAAAAPAKAPRVDGKGRVIPESIADAFVDQRAEVNEWLADFRTISERLLGQRTKSGYASLAWPEIEAALLRVANAVRAEALPYAVCPYCSGDGCDACKGNGWLPRAGWQCVAPELAGKD